LVIRSLHHLGYSPQASLARQDTYLCERREIGRYPSRFVTFFTFGFSHPALLTCINIVTARTLAENVKGCISKPSISAGVGLIYRFDPVRVEVNFGVPLVANSSDVTRKGIQVGIGLEFL
jgi:hypothetical protein